MLAAFEALFENARKFGLDVDLHIDETNNPACNGVALLCEAREAARACGVGHWAIIRRHIVPNLIGVVMVYVTLTIPQVILVESFLSFLGLGVQEPMSSWGALVNDGAQDMESAPWTLAFPAAFLTITLYCFNYIGDGMRDALDPKDKS